VSSFLSFPGVIMLGYSYLGNYVPKRSPSIHEVHWPSGGGCVPEYLDLNSETGYSST
jgi:hypothetical protein